MDELFGRIMGGAWHSSICTITISILETLLCGWWRRWTDQSMPTGDDAWVSHCFAWMEVCRCFIIDARHKYPRSTEVFEIPIVPSPSSGRYMHSTFLNV